MPKTDVIKRVNSPAVQGAGSSGGGVLIPVTASNADTVDNLHASSVPVPGRLLALDGSGKWPTETLPDGLVTGDRQVIAGAGLTGGGTLAADITLDVGAGTGILVGADTVAIDTAANLTWTGNHTHQGLLTTRHILPEATDTYDLGSSTRMWRKGWLSELEAVVFAEQVASLVGGWLIVPHGQGTLAADVETSDTSVDFGQAMTPGDFVVLRSSAPAVEYMRVGTLVSGTRYNVTRDLDGSGPNAWPAGTVYLVLGQSGDGRIELNAQDTPRIQVLVQGAAYNQQTEVVRIGSLNGAFGISDERYGFGVGDYAAGTYLRYDPSSGFLLQAGAGTVQIDGRGILISYDASNGLRFAGATGGTYSRIYDSSEVSGSGGLMLKSSTQYWGIFESGGAKLAMDGGFLKLQPRSGATSAIMGFGDASNNWAMLEAGPLVSGRNPGYLKYYLGTGATPNVVGALARPNAPNAGDVWFLPVYWDIPASRAKQIFAPVRMAATMLTAIRLDTYADIGHCYAATVRPSSGSTSYYFTTDPHYQWATRGNVRIIHEASTGTLYVLNGSTVTVRVVGWVTYTI